MKRIIIIWLGLLCYACSDSVQDTKHQDSYNYNQAWEAFLGDDDEGAIDYLNKELKDNPGNGYASLLLAVVYEMQKDYGRALTAVNLAIKNIPKQNKASKSDSYFARARIYIKLGKRKKALADLTRAEKLDPHEAVYEKRASLYYDMGRYGLADENYRKIISLDSAKVSGYMGVGRCANAEERYNDALSPFNYVEELSPYYLPVYLSRAESYIGLRKYKEAIDDIIHGMDVFDSCMSWYSKIIADIADNIHRRKVLDSCMSSWDTEISEDSAMGVLYLKVLEIADSARDVVAGKLQTRMKEEPGRALWPYLLGVCFERANLYAEAIEWYKKAFKIEADTLYRERMINCCYGILCSSEDSLFNAIEFNYDNARLFSAMGDHDAALYFLRKALEDSCVMTRVKNDSDLDNIRHSEEFQNLLKEFGMSN